MPTYSDTTVIILAAGKGTRMRSNLAKVLHRAGGRTLIEHVIRACLPLKAAQLLVVVGHQADEVGAVAAHQTRQGSRLTPSTRPRARLPSGNRRFRHAARSFTDDFRIDKRARMVCSSAVTRTSCAGLS